MVERANQYLETSFLPGRTFTGPADLNAQLAHWLTPAKRAHGPGTAEPAGGPDRPDTGGDAPAATVPPAIGCRSLIPTQPSRLHRTSTAGMPAHAS